MANGEQSGLHRHLHRHLCLLWLSQYLHLQSTNLEDICILLVLLMLLQAPTNHMYLSVSCLVVGQRGHLEQTASQHVLRRHFFDSPGAKAQLNKISQDLQRLTCNAAHRKNGNAMPRNGYISILVSIFIVSILLFCISFHLHQIVGATPATGGNPAWPSANSAYKYKPALSSNHSASPWNLCHETAISRPVVFSSEMMTVVSPNGRFNNRFFSSFQNVIKEYSHLYHNGEIE